MLHKISTLPNGLRVVTRTMEDAESVTVCFFVGAGGRYEDQNKENGAAHYLEHLLFKGTKNRPEPYMIAEEIDSVGGYMNAYTAEDHTCFYIKLPKHYVGLAFNILSDIIVNPLFKDDEVERERGVILEEMNLYKDDPGRYVYDLVGDLLWPEDGLRSNVLGTPESISDMPKQIIIDYFKNLYCMDNIVVSVAGNVGHARVVELAEELLARQNTRAARGYEHIRGGVSDKLSNIIVQDVNQTHLVVAARGPHIDAPDESAVKVLCTIMGSGMSSRLFRNVREKKGLAYHVYMGMDNYVDSGKLEIYAGVNNDKIVEAIEAICDEIKLLRRSGVEKRELEKAKEQVRGRMIMGLESNSAVADMIGTELVISGRVWTLEEVLHKIDQVTAEDVLEAAEAYLQPENLRLAAIGPLKDNTIKQLEEILRRP